MREIERLAREIGVAIGDCGAEPGSRFSDEVAVVLGELAAEPAPVRRRGLARIRTAARRPEKRPRD